jgi:hypothetical protein
MAKEMGKEEKVGFHKGSLATLTKEREELMRILQIVEQLMQMHIKELKGMGVDLVAMAKDASKGAEPQKLKGKKPIEDVLR